MTRSVEQLRPSAAMGTKVRLLLGAALAAVAASRLMEASRTIDPAIPAFAFMAERWNGLVALREIIAATANTNVR